MIKKPTKPKFKPFALKVASLEAAYILWHRLNVNGLFNPENLKREGYTNSGAYPNFSPTLTLGEFCDILRKDTGNLWKQVDDQLDAISFNPSLDDPNGTPTIVIGDKPVVFLNGSIKVGCTTVDNQTVLKIAERIKKKS